MCSIRIATPNAFSDELLYLTIEGQTISSSSALPGQLHRLIDVEG
nr:MAG TPA: hypothetical protein [Myoviridae sp. ctfuG5]